MAKGGKGKGQVVETGTDEDDVLAAQADTTKINGGDGADLINGGDQADDVRAGDGDDTVSGGAGDDTIFGNDGNDMAMIADLSSLSIEAGKGNSWIASSSDGADTLKHIEQISDGTFTYTVGENNGVFDLGDTASVSESGYYRWYDFLDNAFDVEGDSFSLTGVDATSAAGAALELTNNNDGIQYGSLNGVYEYLAVGETATDSFSYTVTDSAGVERTQEVTVTINGVNDGPVITGGDTDGAVSELASGDAGSNTATLTDSGVISFADVDLSDSHSVSVVDGGAGYLGTLSASVSDASTGDGSGAVTWDFSVADGALDSLQEGEVVNQSYAVTVDDGNGGTATETVNVAITGAADAIVIDFDSGTNTVDYSNYYSSGGSYQQDGYTFNWNWYNYYGYGDGYGVALDDPDGDGDNELSASPGGYYAYGYGNLTQDNGDTFSLVGLSVEGDDGTDYYGYYDEAYVSHYNGNINTWAYNNDDGSDLWTVYSYDYSLGTYTAAGVQTNDLSPYFEDVSSLYLQTYNYWHGYTQTPIAIDDIEVA